ncbi:peptide ABC transporter substrate-binding protein [Mesorhizobium sp. LSHC422A00]|uniref:ABC transporter substrate-binding protein n=1 Tax=Mesorhizobium sp. LSHC422A00 TaxID=1287294 RepID=UPI0003CE10C5|nr:ABC transporter substrate-binding protein [Mesorhizobium sp. LSHC422A00]ESX51817.1 peptide ABC transporter substrate-binding protein [Mesorhizobium sp. LSHC422A00]
MAQHRGGTMRLLAVASEGTGDPQVNYTLKNWQVFQYTYDGLLAFKKADRNEGFTVVPDLAEALPDLQDGGKTYVFTLRKGIKFSNGDELSVHDVTASFRRIFKVLGPTAGTFYHNIVGADGCLKSPDGCTLEGGVDGNEGLRTVTFHLTQPDPEFLYKLAVPHASILPASTPSKDQGTTPIPGTGPYMIESYHPNTSMILVRNPHFKEWSADAQPDGFADEIHYDYGLTEEAAITAIENGQADWMYDAAPADRLDEIGTQYADQVHVTPLAAFWYAPMNTNLAPFDDIRVRQALNYAIDRSQIVNLYGGPVLAQPSCQILPPNFPGHVDSCVYTKEPGDRWSAPDLDKARSLVKASGTIGQRVQIIAADEAVSKAIGTYLQSVLTDLGYEASVIAISSEIQGTYIKNSNNNVQISITQWYADYPAASNFLNVLLSCASFTRGSDNAQNSAQFCDPGFDAKMNAALKQAVSDPEGADRAWADIDQEAMEKSPILPLITPKHVDFVSKRLGNFIFSNQFLFVFSQAWVR